LPVALLTLRARQAIMSKMSYSSYLRLPELLACQSPESARAGAEAHDEMLFIVVHQTYELWFKQILHELDAALAIMRAEFVGDRELGQAANYLARIVAIQVVIVEQIAILETMTPLDFLDFRHLLTPSSGFQSAQFRGIENRLGLKRATRLPYNEAAYDSVLDAAERPRVAAAEEDASLFDLVERWLARTPFVRYREFDFWTLYRDNVTAMLAHDRHTIESRAGLNEAAKKIQLAGLEQTRAGFDTVFDQKKYEEARARGERRLSYDAFLAALMISLYRDEPMLQTPFRLLTTLVNIDENLSLWRYRHALMVNRMIGGKIGTGGSSGQDYLKRTVDAHRIFVDLFNLSTFLIPRSKLPALPAELQRELGFRYSFSDRSS
jgi:tryptophan 2,3-dioxygenase